ncbi:hypothetical protein D9611_014515 [Ephemerocybe angulata]|uniref:Uncharacterized protein n=1 Tax=Ephemerocybe angulata TaxID=980116 RepID=A0A8H5CBJ4_9AGAR|nr:hypothetical protein D9611_014515 [Tulosesus angulatus]
MGARQTSEQAG